MIVGTPNRIVRAALGSVHVYAAIALARRFKKHWDQSASEGEEGGGGGLAWAWTAYEVVGLLALLHLAGIWFSSGYFGQ